MPPFQFFSLTPEHVLDAVEASGRHTTGFCQALGSLENRVYEVEMEDGERVVGKFYRPGRWSFEAILDEHRLLAQLVEAEIPACAPLAFPDGKTLHTTQDGIYFALFPRVGGRSPDELSPDQYEQVGRLLGRIHNVSSALRLANRSALSPQTYGLDCLGMIVRTANLPNALASSYSDVVSRLCAVGERMFSDGETFVVHADCHRGNLLCGRTGFTFLDFDDMAVGPPVQDLWLLLPAPPDQCPTELDALITGYQCFRPFARRTLGLIEILRGLRYVRYAAWIASRWEDPSFPRAFPQFGSVAYWEGQLGDVREQLARLSQ